MIPTGLLLALALASCGARRVDPASVRPGDSVAARAAGLHEVRFRPVFELPSDEARQLVQAVPGGQWDAGLAAAAGELLSLHVDRTGRIDAATSSLVAGRAGYPGQVRFARTLNGGAFPQALVDQAATAAAAAGATRVDLGLAVRRYEDGTALWILAWSHRLAHLDPVPRNLALDQALPVTIELLEPDLDGAELRLFVAPPQGEVDELSLSDGVTRWVDRFHLPGHWRLEAVASQGERSEVVLLMSVWVDGEPPRPQPLQAAPERPENPILAEQQLFAALNRFRVDNGLAPVEWFSTFEPLVREHSAYMAASGQVRHVISGLTPGVAERARGYAFPYAFHHEAVAAAPTSDEAMHLVLDSPAHRKVLLCQACTHATIGVALEPALSRLPRLFVTWELLEQPKGPPKRIDNLDR